MKNNFADFPGLLNNAFCLPLLLFFFLLRLGGLPNLIAPNLFCFCILSIPITFFYFIESFSFVQPDSNLSRHVHYSYAVTVLQYTPNEL